MSPSLCKEQYYYQLTTLLQAGISSTAATRQLYAQGPRGLPDFSKALAEGTAAGMTLGDSLKCAPRSAWEPLETAMLAAAERGGKLELATRQLSQHFGLQGQLWAQVQRAMLYPLLVLHAAVVLPSITVFLGQGSYWTQLIKPLLTAYAIIAVLWIGGRWLWAQGKDSVAVDRFLNCLPGLGAWRKNLAAARFCQALGIQLQAGEMVDQAVRLSGRAAATAGLKQSSKAMAEEIKAQGCPLGPMLLGNAAFSTNLAQLLATAEMAGRLDQEANHRAQALMEEAKRAAGQSGFWLPKVLYFPIAFFAIYRIISFFANYMSGITEGLGLDG